jgi:hypothetical protein
MHQPVRGARIGQRGQGRQGQLDQAREAHCGIPTTQCPLTDMVSSGFASQRHHSVTPAYLA